MAAGEGGMRVPLIIAGLGIQGGRKTGAFAYVWDLMPTLMEISRAEYPSEFQGRQLDAPRGRSMMGVPAQGIDSVRNWWRRLTMERTLSNVRSATCWLGLLVVVVLIVVASPLQVVAQEPEQHEAASAEHEAAGEQHEATAEEHQASEEPGEEHGEEHEFHKHHIAVILSATESPEEHGEEHNGDGHGDTHSEGSSGGKDDPDFTVGFDYERRFTRLFGLGGMVDWVAEGRREFLFGPIAILHPFAGSKFWVAPLAERVRATSDWELVWRIGVGWDIPIGKSGKYSIAPNVNYDITDEHELWVLGVAIGRGF